MPDLYVVVHEEVVDFHIEYLESLAAAEALRVKGEISRIRREHDFIEVSRSARPYSAALPQGLPPPSNGLTIVLAGAYKDVCVKAYQMILEKAGYSVRVYEAGCLE